MRKTEAIAPRPQYLTRQDPGRRVLIASAAVAAQVAASVKASIQPDNVVAGVLLMTFERHTRRTSPAAARQHVS